MKPFVTLIASALFVAGCQLDPYKHRTVFVHDRDVHMNIDLNSCQIIHVRPILVNQRKLQTGGIQRMPGVEYTVRAKSDGVTTTLLFAQSLGAMEEPLKVGQNCPSSFSKGGAS